MVSGGSQEHYGDFQTTSFVLACASSEKSQPWLVLAPSSMPLIAHVHSDSGSNTHRRHGTSRAECPLVLRHIPSKKMLSKMRLKNLISG